MPRLADEYELEALLRADSNSSVLDIVRTVRQSGVLEVETDPLDDDGVVDRGGERAEVIGNDLAREVEARAKACGGPSNRAYPFRVEADYIEKIPRRPLAQPYTFMLLLTLFGGRAGPRDINAERLFESISAHAAHRYFGGPRDGVKLVRFAFPRRDKSSFLKALRELATDLGEGGQAVGGKDAQKPKDGAVDVIVFHHFPDGAPGKLIAFGQCASGKHWEGKRGELNPHAFCGNWLTSPLVTDTLLKLFFLPRRLDSGEWDKQSRHAGIIFDRCRIAAFCTDLDAETRDKCSEWTSHVLATKARAA